MDSTVRLLRGSFRAVPPTIVVYVMIDQPSGAYYGGELAAPLVKSLLPASARSASSPLDASRLTATLARRFLRRYDTTPRTSHLVSWPQARDNHADTPPVSFLMLWTRLASGFAPASQPWPQRQVVR